VNLRNILQKEIRQGAPGGKKWDALSTIAQKVQEPGHRKPFQAKGRQMSRAIQYSVDPINPSSVKVGFVDSKKGNVSESWKAIAAASEVGTDIQVTDRMRRFLRRRGQEILGATKTGKLRKNSPARKFFLKRETVSLIVPARPIFDPFWQRHEVAAWKRIRKNWYLKYKYPNRHI
jgi:hypothetical protein